MDRPFDRVLLFSGGLDSLILWRLLDHPPTVYIDLGHDYADDEVGAIEDLTDALRARGTESGDTLYPLVLMGPHLGDQEQEDGHIPHRNLHLALAASHLAETIYLGALAGESSPDKSGRFMRRAGAAISASEGKRTRLVAPYRNLTKPELVRLYLQRFPAVADADLLRLTRSCYRPEGPPCGRCMACFRRWVAMSLNGLWEEYENDPALWSGARFDTARAWRYLRRAPWTEWLAITRNNLYAARALRHAREAHRVG